ncbi:MAG: hypothetical protein IKR04_03585 [Clostridia bacterium]|nr:hypothetical protein [Clostridia bacterium]
MIIDFSNPWIFLLWYIITVGLLFASFKLKKSKICLGPVCYFMLILLIHSKNPDWFMDIYIHRFFNFLGLGAALAFFVAMDEVETRRLVISQVFKNRYKKDKLPSETGELLEESDDEDEEEDE